jgi:hypothetical protein
MSTKPTLTVTSDFTADFNDIVKKFKNDAVLVGIPEQDTKREEDEGDSEITNAALLAICNFGSPVQNIPAWPVMAIGIRNAQEEIATQFKLAATNALKMGLSALDIYYNRAGIIASTSIKKVINSQEDVPPNKPSPSTLKSRKSAGFKGQKYWIRTGQMRNAITYVVKGEVK